LSFCRRLSILLAYPGSFVLEYEWLAVDIFLATIYNMNTLLKKSSFFGLCPGIRLNEKKSTILNQENFDYVRSVSLFVV